MKYLQNILLVTVFTVLNLVPGNAPAETVIYKESARESSTGNGFTTQYRRQTFILYSTTTQRPLALIHSTMSPTLQMKWYSVITNVSDYQVVRGIAGPKGNETVMFRTTTTTNSTGRFDSYTYFTRGHDATLDLGNGTTVVLPKTMKATIRGVDDVLGFPSVFESSSAVSQFQPLDTRIANTQGETLAQTIERIRARLEAQGYERSPGSA